MRRRLFFRLAVFFLLFSVSLSLSSAEAISPYTKGKIGEFMDLRVRIRSTSSDSEAVAIISAAEDEALGGLLGNAADMEQETCILRSMYLVERHEHLLAAKNRDALRKLMKSQMSRNVACLEERLKSGAEISSWLYLYCGDITSYYMTRSIPATLLYGLRVKAWYEGAVALSPKMTLANVSLGNWYFYAPPPFGSRKKSERCYKAAVEGAEADGEKYLAYQFLSQLYFEMGNASESAACIDKAASLGLGTAELDAMRELNGKGISLFAHNRNRVGIDEDIPEDAKEADDR
ncbi:MULTISPECIES: hypothetical protein [Treponema]|uniref:hypothetical protein n=1 Tax=Treponema TaxID=157 RepID=UPI00257C3D3B|nr:hypothetical protein [Treponema sp.]MBQ5537757.1 hypothetical protein [Treponema sp.]